MDPTSLTRIQAAGRLTFGTAMMLAPERVAAGWIGSRDGGRAGVQLLTQALGIRDAVIAAGVLATTGASGGRNWLLAGTAADAIDLAATVRARGSIPSSAAVGVSLLAAGSTALGLYLASRA